MTAYYYIKKEPVIRSSPVKKEGFKVRKNNRKFKWLSGVFLGAGLILLANVTFPIFDYFLKSEIQFKQKLLVPVSGAEIRVLGEKSDIDYRHPKNWFSAAPSLPDRQSKITHYSISIPSLGIENATVEIGGDDLMESMIHYPGTALPGDYGNVVIFCHSALPQLFSPKNYKTICATLPRMKVGEEVLINYDGIAYHYQIINMVEVKPDDMAVLAQHYDSQYLSVITCVPPGTYLRRLIVRGKLI